MTAHNDLDRQLDDFLGKGPSELPYQSFDAVRDGTLHTPQRVVVGTLRLPEINRIVAIGLGAAAVVAVLLVGSFVFGSPAGRIGSQATPPPGPTKKPAPSEAVRSVEPAVAHELPEGSLLLWDGSPDGVSITVNLSGDGWWGRPGQGWFTKGNDSNPPGTGMIVYGSVEEYYVYGDPCHWQSTKPETPAATVEEMVAALQIQAPGGDALGTQSTASEPVDISLDGYNGSSITLKAPTIFAHDCDQDQMAIFASEDRSPDRYLQRGGPDGGGQQGQFDELWILDVNGQIVVLDIAYYWDTPQDTIDELRDILASATFDAP